MIYLNNAATSWPKASGVADALAAAINSPPEGAGRANIGVGGEADCRELLARLLSVSDPRRIIYASNATHALNMAILGFPWRPDDVAVTTAAEHNSVLRPLHLLQKQGKIAKYVVLPVDEAGRVPAQEWREAMSGIRPRLAAFTHASNVSGAVNDAQTMTAEAHAVGACVLVDASQTIGLIPVKPELWGADLLALTGHKYLLGPQGTGALYVGPETGLDPVFSGGTGIHSDEYEMPRELPLRLEAGTGNSHSFAGLKAALEWAEANPLDQTRLHSLDDRIEATLTGFGYRPIRVKNPRTPIIAFTSPRYSAEDIGEMLYCSYGIVCRTGLHCAPGYPDCGGTVRLSLSRFTTDIEIDELLFALREIHR